MDSFKHSTISARLIGILSVDFTPIIHPSLQAGNLQQKFVDYKNIKTHSQAYYYQHPLPNDEGGLSAAEFNAIRACVAMRQTEHLETAGNLLGSDNENGPLYCAGCC